MWSTDDLDLLLTEQRIESATGLPPVSDKFRAKVLMESFAVQQQTQSVQRIQTLTTSLLAITLLICLPGYYRSLREPQHWKVPELRPLQPEVSKAPVYRGIDHYEWDLVESALSFRTQAARNLAQTL